MSVFNPYQDAAKKTYWGGEFSHVNSTTEAEDVGDTLFLFLMRELSSSEGCDSPEEAIRRLDKAITDLEEVRTGLQGLL